MTRSPSLTRRLIVNLSFAQIAAVVTAWFMTSALIAFGFVGAYGFWFDEMYSYYRIRDHVSQSIVQAADGSLRLEPDDALRMEAERTPTLRIAAFKSMSEPALPGSSPDLSAALRGVTRLEIRGMDYFYEIEGRKNPGAIWQWKTPVGLIFIAAAGWRFHWLDLLHAYRNDLVAQSTYLLTVFSGSAVVAWLAVRRGLAPLRRAAEAAGRIDLDSLGQGIRVDDAPIEIRPLIDAVNRALARLDASVARMRRYTANAAHELRTPVAILRARLENPEERDSRADLNRDARRIQTIVEQMLVVARLTEGQIARDQEFDLCALARGIVADYSPLIFRSRRRIALEAPEAPVRLRSNQTAIERVVANLIDNALRAEPEGGTVLVRVDARGKIAVIDHGDGVAESDRSYIFEPFWRRNDALPGTGLGLAIAKELVDMLGGSISVCDSPGGGATFELSLPPAGDAPGIADSAPRATPLSVRRGQGAALT